MGNRRGARCIHILDALLLVNLIRWPFALIGFIDHKRFVLYSKVRLFTWYVQSFILLAGLLVDIFMEVFMWDAKKYAELTAAALFLCIFVGTDYHLTTVVRFFA